MTIKQKWKEWKKVAIESGVDQKTMKEVEAIFYSGFHAAIHSFLSLSRKKADVREKCVKALIDESEEYWKTFRRLDKK